MIFLINIGPVAQRIRRLTTDQKIPGSNPGRVAFKLNFEHCGEYILLKNETHY